MRKITADCYKYFIKWAKMNTANTVYPMSIAEGFQTGDIYVNDGDEITSVVFWHYCGFGFISGTPSKSFLDEITDLDGDRRLILITNEDWIADFYRERSYEISDRIEFIWGGEYKPVPVNEEFSIEPITSDNILSIKGRIVPSFSWSSPQEFLENGYGYVAIKDGGICAVAFAAVSSEEVDIGVETYEEYRKKGLSSALTSKMIGRILEEGKKPVWSCAKSNEASQRTAIKAGFKPAGVNKVIKVKE